MVDPTAGPDGGLLQEAQPRQRLAGVADRRAGPSTASTHAEVAVAMPDKWHSRFRAVRSAVKSSLVGARNASTTCPGSTRWPSGSSAVTS